MEYKLLLYRFMISLFNVLKQLFEAETRLCIKVIKSLEHWITVYSEKRDLTLLSKQLVEKPYGFIYNRSPASKWDVLSFNSAADLLEEMGCEPMLSRDYGDDINYEATYTCREINRLVKLSVKYKVVEHLWIEWWPLAMRTT